MNINEDVWRNIMESAKERVGRIPFAELSGMTPMSGTTPEGGINNIDSTINDLATSTEWLLAVQENMGQGDKGFDFKKFNDNMAAMPGLGIADVPSLELMRGAGQQMAQSPQVQALTAAGDNMGLMELIKRAQSMGRM